MGLATVRVVTVILFQIILAMIVATMVHVVSGRGVSPNGRVHLQARQYGDGTFGCERHPQRELVRAFMCGFVHVSLYRLPAT